MPRILNIQGLSFGYRAGAAPVLHNISLQLNKGEILILSGPSGSGKSTLISLIGLLRQAPPGSINLFGADLGTADRATQLALRQRLRCIFQRHYLLHSLTALQNVAAGQHFQSRPGLADPAALLAALGLGDKLGRWPEELSGGEQQRVAVARALVSAPELLLADEPTASLDYENARLVVDGIAAQAARLGCGVILATHDERIMDVGTRRVEMRDGRLLPG